MWNPFPGGANSWSHYDPTYENWDKWIQRTEEAHFPQQDTEEQFQYDPRWLDRDLQERISEAGEYEYYGWHPSPRL